MASWRARAAVLGVASAAFVVMFACGGGSSSVGENGATCSPVAACPNDPPPDVADCQSKLNDPNCGVQNLALHKCVVTNTHCDANGKSDATPVTACAKQIGDALLCSIAHPPADAGGGG